MIKHRIEKDEVDRLDWGTNQNVREYWEEDGVAVRYKYYYRKTPIGGSPKDLLSEEGEGSGLRFVIKKYSFLNDQFPGHLQEVQIFDWKPSNGSQKLRIRQWHTEMGRKCKEWRYDANEILSEIIHFNSSEGIIHHQYFEEGNGDYVSLSPDGEVEEFGAYRRGRRDGKRYRLFKNQHIAVEEFSDGKLIGREKLAVRVWAELLQERGIS